MLPRTVMSTNTTKIATIVWKPSILLPLALIFFGVLTISLPLAASVAVVLIIGWLLLLSGITQIVYSFQSKGIGHIIWKLLVAAFYTLAGVYMISRPALGISSLTLALALFFFAEGATDLIAYLSTRKTGGSGWMLVDAVVTLALGFMVRSRWPFNSPWILGTFAGSSMLMAGIVRLMMALAVRKLAKDERTHPIQQDRAA